MSVSRYVRTYLSPYVRPSTKIVPISMKFGVWIEVDD